MRSSTKAALISGFLFPGLGHVYLKKYRSGLILILIAGISIYFVISATIDTALWVASEIETKGIALDPDSISQLLEQQPNNTSQSVSILSMTFLITWVVAVIDVLRVGRTQEA